MFRGLKSKAVPPPLSEGNPGQGKEVNVAFANGERTWGERFDLLDSLTAVLAARGIGVERGKAWLRLESGIVLQPQIVSVQPLEDGTISTITTIDISQAALIPNGMFEYQHANDKDTATAVAAGFESWAGLDLPVFMDALREKPQHCMMLALDGEHQTESPFAGRRVVLGPTAHMAKEPASEVAGDHDFCPCCMFTKNFEAFKPLLDGKEVQAIRFFAMRNAEGEAEADCRVNGHDWQPGKKALIEYVGTWPDRGFELRKQFGVIHSVK